jgi:hypothetical protein
MLYYFRVIEPLQNTCVKDQERSCCISMTTRFVDKASCVNICTFISADAVLVA